MILVDNVKLYTGERSFPDGAVLVEGEKILYAGSRAACPKAEVSLLPGGQPVYYYMISAE